MLFQCISLTSHNNNSLLSQISHTQETQHFICGDAIETCPYLDRLVITMQHKDAVHDVRPVLDDYFHLLHQHEDSSDFECIVKKFLS